MLKLCVCSVSSAYNLQMTQKTMDYCAPIPMRYDLTRFYNPKIFLKSLDTFNVYFLDYDNVKDNINEIIEFIQKKNKEALLIFMSDGLDGAVAAFKYHAVGFIRKPFVQEEIKEVLDRTRQIVEKEMFSARTVQDMILLSVSGINYVNTEMRNICYHKTDGEKIYGIIPQKAFKVELKDLLERHEDIVLIASALAVNINQVKRIGQTEAEFFNGEVIHLTRPARERLYTAWKDYTEERGY